MTVIDIIVLNNWNLPKELNLCSHQKQRWIYGVMIVLVNSIMGIYSQSIQTSSYYTLKYIALL